MSYEGEQERGTSRVPIVYSTTKAMKNFSESRIIDGSSLSLYIMC